MRIFIALLLGALFGGFLAKYMFHGSAINLIPWALVGLGTGIFARNIKEAIISGVLYGFFLSFLFMVSGYTGAQPLITRFPPFAILGLFGAFCGGVLGIIGFFVRRFTTKEKISVSEKRR